MANTQPEVCITLDFVGSTLSWARAAVTFGRSDLDRLFDLLSGKNVSSEKAGAWLVQSLFYFQ